MQDLGRDLGYISDPCPNCGRVRVIAYSGGKHICQKCDWCVEDNGYFNWDQYEYVEDEASNGLWRAMKGEPETSHLDKLWREARDELYESMFCGD